MEYAPASEETGHDHHGHSHGGQSHGRDREESIRERLDRDYREDQEGIEWGALEEADEGGFTRLHYAALDDMIPICLGLLQRHPDWINACQNTRRQTPLHWACLKGHLAVVVLLLERGADPNVSDTEGYTPLTTAVQYNFVPILHCLVQHGGLLDTVDNEGHHLMHWAAYFGHERVTDYLLVQGQTATTLDFSGRTPIHWAALKGHYNVLNLLADSLKVCLSSSLIMFVCSLPPPITTC